ncbi:TPA: hypothetical protein ACH3X1_012773 [Trebouxia sp. C0004]
MQNFPRDGDLLIFLTVLSAYRSSRTPQYAVRIYCEVIRDSQVSADDVPWKLTNELLDYVDKDQGLAARVDT